MGFLFVVSLLIVSAVLGWLINGSIQNKYLDAIHVLFPLIVLAVCFRLIMQGYPYYALGLFVFYSIIFSVSMVLRAKKRKAHYRSWK